MSEPMTRRQWLGGAAAAGAAFTMVPRHVLGGVNHTAPSDKLALAGIGIEGIGFPQLQACESAGFEIVALCDVDHGYAWAEKGTGVFSERRGGKGDGSLFGTRRFYPARQVVQLRE